MCPLTFVLWPTNSTTNLIPEIPEAKVVERLLSDPIWATEMFELYGNPQGTSKKTRVPLPSGFQGDADIILFAPRQPERAVALEVKRIKFGVSALRPGGKPNKLHEYEKAVQQANRLYQVGFWKVYLYAITVVDAREQNATHKLNSGKLVFDGLSMQMRSLVASVVTTNELNPNVGLCDLDLATRRWTKHPSRLERTDSTSFVARQSCPRRKS